MSDEMIGDYVLGLLTGEDLRAFEAAMAGDTALVARVAALQEKLQALDDTVVPEAVPAGLWQRIEAQLPAVSKPAVVARKPKRLDWVPMAASIVMAAGVGFLAGQEYSRQPAPVVIAVLVSDDSTPGAIVEAFANNSVHFVPLEAFSVPDGKIIEVWTKPNEEIGPVSLGQFSRPEDIVLKGIDLPVPQAGQLYEITLEDAPRSPTGKPTGPILAKGLAQAPAI